MRNGGVWVAAVDVLRTFWRLRSRWWGTGLGIAADGLVLLGGLGGYPGGYALVLLALVVSFKVRTVYQRGYRLLLALPIGRDTLGTTAWCEAMLIRPLLLVAPAVLVAKCVHISGIPVFGDEVRLADSPLIIVTLAALAGAGCLAKVSAAKRQRMNIPGAVCFALYYSVAALLVVKAPIIWRRLDILGGAGITAGLVLGVIAFPFRGRLVGPDPQLASVKAKAGRQPPTAARIPGNGVWRMHLWAMLPVTGAGGAVSFLFLVLLIAPGAQPFIRDLSPGLATLWLVPLAFDASTTCELSLPLRVLRTLPISAGGAAFRLARVCASANAGVFVLLVLSAFILDATRVPMMLALFVVSVGVSLVLTAVGMYCGWARALFALFVAMVVTTMASYYVVEEVLEAAPADVFLLSWQVVAVVGGLLVVAGMVALRFAVPRGAAGRGLG